VGGAGNMGKGGTFKGEELRGGGGSGGKPGSNWGRC